MKMVIKEENVLIAVNAMKKIMDIFVGPFLTAYFIKTSMESIFDLSFYKIIAFFVLSIGSFFVAYFVKNRFKIGMFRIGVIFNFMYIMAIVVWKEKIMEHLVLLAILYGVSASAYWFPYNLFAINKVKNADRTSYTVKSKLVSSLVKIICPFLLGSMITISNYHMTAIVILVVSFIQIILSFLLKPMDDTKLPTFDLVKTWKKIKSNTQVKRMFLLEYLIGFNISDGALEVVMTLLIFQTFQTDRNLGMITSIASILTMIVIQVYGKKYQGKKVVTI